MDPKQHKETGLVKYIHYIHDSLIFKRLHHLEQHVVESVWTGVTLKEASLFLLPFVGKNPVNSVDWPDDFISVMDAVCLESKEMTDAVCLVSKEIIPLEDFNTDLFKSNNYIMASIA